jgi:hypothetical protein
MTDSSLLRGSIVTAKWLAHRVGWMSATLRLPLVIPPELSRRLYGSDALVPDCLANSGS